MRPRDQRVATARHFRRVLEQLAAELQQRRAFTAVPPLVEPAHHVEVLHRLIRRRPSPGCRCTLTTNTRAVRLVHLPADVAEVRLRDVLDLGQGGPGDPHERRRGVGLRERGAHLPRPSCPAPGARSSLDRRPRSSGTRCGTKVTRGQAPAPSPAYGDGRRRRRRHAAVVLGEVRAVATAPCPRRRCLTSRRR